LRKPRRGTNAQKRAEFSSDKVNFGEGCVCQIFYPKLDYWWSFECGSTHFEIL